MPHTRYAAVIGPGATGGLLADSLARSGRDVLLVSSREGAARLRKNGLTVVSENGRKRTRRGWLAVEHAPSKRPGCEAVFICVKHAALSKALSAAKRLAGPDTPIVSLLNGAEHLSPFKRAAGAKRAVAGVCYYAAMRESATVVRHMGGRGIALGRGKDNAEALSRAAAILRSAGWKVEIFSSDERLLWTKMVFNAGVNSLGALARASNGSLADEPALRELLVLAAGEAAAIARADGKPSYYPDVPGKLVASCRAVKDQKNSMLQDLEAGRRTEADAILLPLLKAARRRGIKPRLLGPIYDMVRALEKELA